MMRAFLAALLLSLTVLAFAPSAEAGPVCDTVGVSDYLDQTWALACTPPDCLYTTAPVNWRTCASLAGPVGYAACYLVTGPINYVPDCT